MGRTGSSYSRRAGEEVGRNVQPESRQSLRAIGREIAKEIERYFEAKVNPETLRSKIRRISGSFDPPQATPQEDPKSGEIQSPTTKAHSAEPMRMFT